MALDLLATAAVWQLKNLLRPRARSGVLMVAVLASGPAVNVLHVKVGLDQIGTLGVPAVAGIFEWRALPAIEGPSICPLGWTMASLPSSTAMCSTVLESQSFAVMLVPSSSICLRWRCWKQCHADHA